MKKRKFLIAGGNSTLLVWSCSLKLRKNIIKQNLGHVEQVGFVSMKNTIPTLEMMGNELCMNATLGLAKFFKKEGALYTSGLMEKVTYKNGKNLTSITLPLPYQHIDNIVLFPGIGFIYKNNEKTVTKQSLSLLASKFNLPAFGSISFKNKILQPYVFVKETNSLFKETACGSGSIAINILTGNRNITQPTGEIISVFKQKNLFTISAVVNQIPLSNTEKNDTLKEVLS